MCLSPVKIRNPNFGCTAPLLVATTDCVSEFINVPCGVCCECIAKKQSDLVQRCRVLCLDHYMFFYTLTYNNESLPHVITSTGFDLSYADHKDIYLMFKRIRNDNLFGYPFLYLSVSERGSRRGRPHFHGLIFIKKSYNTKNDPLFTAQLESKVRKVLFSQWKRNYGSKRSPDYRPLFTYKSRFISGKRYSNFDCHYCVPHSTDNGETDVAFYVTKYLLKPSANERKLQQALRLNLDDSEYAAVWKIVRSKMTKSHDFGLCTAVEENFVRSQIMDSNESPQGLHFKNPDGSLAPLPRYYRKCVTADDALLSVSARGGPLSICDRNDIELSLQKGRNRLEKVALRDISEITTDL